MNHEYKFLGRLGFQPIIYGQRGDFSPFPHFFISRTGREDYREDPTHQPTSTAHGTVILYTHHSSVLISLSEVSEIVISLHIMTYSLRICAEKIEKATGWG